VNAQLANEMLKDIIIAKKLSTEINNLLWAKEVNCRQHQW